MLDDYEYHAQGRKPGTYLALGVGIAAAFVAHSWQAPPLVWGLWAFYMTFVMWRLLANPSAGFRLTRDRLELIEGRRTRGLDLASIAEVTLVEPKRRDDPALVLTLTDGSRVPVPGAGPAQARLLASELAERGVPPQD